LRSIKLVLDNKCREYKISNQFLIDEWQEIFFCRHLDKPVNYIINFANYFLDCLTNPLPMMPMPAKKHLHISFVLQNLFSKHSVVLF
jgi:hypothetical protein